MREDHEDLKSRTEPFESTARRFNPDPKVNMERTISDIGQKITGLVTGIEQNIDQMDEAKLAKIEFFLNSKVAEMVRAARLVLVKQPSALTGFSFDLEVPTPTTPAPSPVSTVNLNITQGTQGRRPPAMSAANTPRVEGRLVGTKEKVITFDPPAEEPPPEDDVADVGFIDE